MSFGKTDQKIQEFFKTNNLQTTQNEGVFDFNMIQLKIE